MFCVCEFYFRKQNFYRQLCTLCFVGSCVIYKRTMSCAVKGCLNHKRFKPKDVTFHRFPKDHRLKKWLEVLGKDEGWQWSSNKFVCSKHFLNNDFERIGQKVYLKVNAIPSVYLKKEPQVTSKLLFSPSASSTMQDTREESIQQKQQSSSSFSSEKSSTDTLLKRSRIQEKKRGFGESSGHETSRSTDSSTKRKRVKFIQSIHNYSHSPRKYKMKYTELRNIQVKSRKKLYAATKKMKTLKREITTLKTVVNSLKEKKTLSEGALSHLEKCYEDIPHVLMSRYIKNIRNATTSRESYPEKLRNFACTLQFYSGKAYEFVRKTFALALPHQSVIRKWCANIVCYPGFCDPCFDALKNLVEKAHSSNKEVICSLLLDEMAIRKQIEFDGKRTWGYIDIGVFIDNYDLQPATEALVLMVVCHTSHWKLPIGYFLIKSLSGSEKANIITEALVRLHETGIIITSVTCDGPAVHLAMLKELGCVLDDVHNMQPWFNHPSNSDTKVFCILDVCHMLKLLRNLLATLGQIQTRDGVVDWKFINKLFELQEIETLKLANKLGKSHIEWQRQKMKVNLAAQTLSASVANALEFLNVELGHAAFKGVEATVSFIKRIDTLFDILNSRSPWAKGFKAPLRQNNEYLWRPFLLDTCKFLLECTDISGRPLYCTSRKTPILGFVISSLSIMGIFDDFVASQKLKYLLTYKCSQDHLEIFFCSVRSRNGWNNNPTCLQFMHTFRRLLLFSSVSERGGNCKVLDDTTVLRVPSTRVNSVPDTNVDISLCRRYNLEIVDDMNDHDYALPHFIELNEFASNVVTYIGGYVVKMIKKTVKCPECISGCTVDNNNTIHLSSYRFLKLKNRGGLMVPSNGIVKICEGCEISIRRIMIITNNKLPKEDNFMSTFVTAIAQQFYNDAERLFPSLIEHNLCSAPNEEQHLVILIKKIISSYVKIRFFNLAKKYTETIQGSDVRKTLTKLILFNHQ